MLNKICFFIRTQACNYCKSFLLIVFAFLLSFHANSQTLEDYLHTAAENNPALKSKFAEYNAALQRIPQVGALPDPELAFSIFVMPMERYMGDQIANISIMQMFPWFGTLSAARSEAGYMAKARFEMFNEEKSLIFYNVKASYYTLLLLEEEIRISQENIEILKSLENMALSRLRSGSGSGGGSGLQQQSDMQGTTTQSMSSGEMSGMTGTSTTGAQQSTQGNMSSGMQQSDGGMGTQSGMVDVLRIQMELLDLENRLSLLQDSRRPMNAEFNQLLNRSREEEIILPDTLTQAELPIPVTELPDSIRLNNPMIKMLEMKEGVYLAQQNMNRRMGFPMIGLGLQYEIFRAREGSESMMNGQNMLMPMATISIPLWRRKYNASVKEAGYMREATTTQREDTGNRLMVNYEEAHKDFRDAERRVLLFQQQTVLAQQALNILMSQYATAGSDFEELLRMQRQLLGYRLNLLDAIVDQNIAVAMMERLMGR